ncbi:fatty acid synthase-like [Schistocerca serialis cubense]|uniref:fatty acid synthase-like n=1 Tax=Schistocerca serialis cubense TaxID=2023355 RepID=UPI00214F402A|nr:fatty acid synthase-like [Schistocerca serialis cubense]XP_049941824.1 fatty acid synthase-like [Schistocerca serialis cubense]
MTKASDSSAAGSDVYAEFITAGKKLASPPPGEELVISGISGHFPKSVGLYELQDNLKNLPDLMTDYGRDRQGDASNIPPRLGKVPHPEKFDASFFGVDAITADKADPLLRMQLETCYEAIVDAGIHPHSLRGKRVAVITAGIFSESEVGNFTKENVGKGLMYCNRAVQAGMIAYWLGVKGPAYIADTACSSSMFALDAAYQFIRTGKCDAALVSGANFCLHDYSTAQFANLGVLSMDGVCRSFDDECNGYVRSEAVGSFLIQKAKDARRMYGQLIHVQTNCDGYKTEGITYPSGLMQKLLLSRFYKECGVDLQSIKYVEAHGTGTKAGDPEEIRAIDNVFCSGKTSDCPLLIGSVKSNLGHSEPVSGFVSIAKVILSMESGIIPANAHYKKPRAGLAALEEGRIKVVAEHTPFPGGPIAINSFGFGGCNSHTLIAPNPKAKVNNGTPIDGLPRLVTASGRTPEAVHAILNQVESMRIADAEFVSLLHELHVAHIPGHLYRGYTIVPAVLGNYGRTVELSPLEKKFSVHILLSLGENKCHPATVGSLMQFDIFSATMNECFQALILEGVDLLFAIFSTDGDEWALRNSITTSVQIALLNLLKTIGVKIDVFIGSCPAKTYAEGGYTIEEAVRAAYELDIEERHARCALNDGSGPRQARAMTPLYDSDVDIDAIKSNYKNFRPQTKDIIVLEISPESKLPNSLNVLTNSRTLLQILGRLYLSHVDLHLTELYPKVQYPVSRGTSMISPFIKWEHSEDWYVTSGNNTSDLIGEHNFSTRVKMLQKKNHYLFGHSIDGRNLFPATGYIIMVLQGYCTRRNIDMSRTAVVFEDVRFHRATNVPKNAVLVFQVMTSSGTNEFEVMEGGSVVVTGRFWLGGAPMLSDGLEPPKPAPGVPMDKKDIYKEMRLRGYNYNGIFRSLISLDPSASVGRIAWEKNWVAYMDNMLQINIFQQDTRNLYVPVQIKRIVADFTKHTELAANSDEDGVLPIYCWRELRLVRSGGLEIFGLFASPVPKRRITTEPVLENYGFVPYQGQSNLSLKELLRVSVHVALENNPVVRKVKAVELPGDNGNEFLSTEIGNILADLPVIQANLTVLDEPPSSDPPEGVQFEKRSLKEESDCLMVLGTGLVFGRNTQHLKDALAALADNGFIISKETLNGDLRDLEQSITVVMNYAIAGGNDHLIVVKKKGNPQTDVQFVNVSGNDCTWLPQLKSLMQKGKHQVVLVAQGNNNSGILGLTNCTRMEPGGTRVRCVFIKDHKAPAFDPNLEFYQSQLALDLSVNVYEKGCWGSYRHLPLKPLKTVKTPHAINVVKTVGDLSSLAWQQGTLNPDRDINTDEIVFIYYSALNFRDIMTATGRLAFDVVNPDRCTQDCIQGIEFSGRDKNGRRVMGIATGGGAMSTMIKTNPNFIWQIPDNWTMADGATVPAVYLTILMAFKKGGLRKGDSVLIHAGSGGIGQAAITYCLFHGCTVFTTVGTQQKKEFILKNFPQVPESHIGNSRDTSFEEMVMKETKGRGVDIVLNSLAEEKLQASVRCLARGGQFLEIGKFDLANDSKLAMDFLSRDISFHGVMLDALSDNMVDDLIALGKDFQNAITEGSVKPLIKTIFKVDEVEQAYRYMAAAKHMGKVLVAVREEEQEKVVRPAILEIDAEPRFYCKPEFTYIIVGGLGGFGLELADWLILRRAKKLVLTSRKGISNGYQESRLRLWLSYGIKVIVSTEDVTTQEGCYKLLTESNKLGPVGGIFNLAVDLQDGILENQTVESFQKSAGPKAVATGLLDVFSQKLCPQLHTFVVFSSVSCGRGNAGQSNYGWSNSVMERICEERHSKGLPALAIQWGAVGDVGLVANMQEDDKEIVIGGTLPQKITSCLSLLDTFFLQPCPIVASMVVAEKRGGLSQSSGILEYVANVLGIKDLKTVNHNAPLAELGMDSIMAVEIKQAVEITFEIFLTAEEVRNLTLSSIVEMAKNSAAEPEVTVPVGDQAISSAVRVPAALMKLESMKTCKLLKHPCLPGSHNVYIFPGIDGDPETMPILSSKICAASLKCFQHGFYDENEYRSIHEIAEFALPYILDDLSRVPTFAIVGFSFGGLVALELTALLESKGYKGTLVLIDSSPDFIKETIVRMGKDYFLSCFTGFLPKTSTVKLQAEAAGLEVSEQVEIAMKLFPHSEIQNSLQARAFCSTIASRLSEVVNGSDPYKTIQSPVTIIKSTGSAILDIGEAYGLEKICKNIVGIHTITGTHFSIVEEAETANIINNELEKSNKH